MAPSQMFTPRGSAGKADPAGRSLESGQGGGQSPRLLGLGMSGWPRALRRLVKGPLTMTDGGPARPRQLGKMECQE